MSMNGLTSTWGQQSLLNNEIITNQVKYGLQKWINKEISTEDMRSLLCLFPFTTHVSLLVNNECNQNCLHCYLKNHKLYRERLATEEWIKALNSAAESNLNIGQYVITGKEPLVGDNGIKVIEELGKIKEKHPCIKIGMVTNDTLITQHYDILKQANLDHIDISIDGNSTEHNLVRGKGSFNKVEENINYADRLTNNLFATLTLQKLNVNKINSIIERFWQMGIENIGISPYEPYDYTDKSLTLSDEDIINFFNSLNDLKYCPHKLFIQTDVTFVEPIYLSHFMKSKWFNMDYLRVDSNGFMYFRYELGDVTLSFRFLPFEIGIESSFRVTADGHIICVKDAMNPREYHINSLANLRDFEFNFEKTVQHAKIKFDNRQFLV